MTTLEKELTLESVLEIWQSTTTRLEQTHLSLQAEVRRLTVELEEKNRQLAKKNRLANIGQMAGHVAHEVRNHLVPLTLYLSLLRRQLVSASASTTPTNAPSPNTPSTHGLAGVELLDKVDSNISAMRTMVQDLLNFTSNRQPQSTDIQLFSLVQELFAEIHDQCHAQGIVLTCDVPRDAQLKCDGEMLRSALRNLLLNAVDALVNGGNILVRTRNHTSAMLIEVADDGDGIPSETLSRIFDPFYTTKQTGTGLGLSIVERIMECHGGQITVSSQEPRGTCFSLCFPQSGPNLSNLNRRGISE